MSDTDQTPELSEDDQALVAMDWYMAMWDEAMKRGVSPETMSLTALSVTASRLSSTFGSAQAASLLKNTAKNVRGGKFDDNESDQDAG